MQEYDVTLKPFLQRSARATLQAVTGTTIQRCLDVDLSKVQNPRADLLGQTADGGLVDLELQSTNDASMPLRMAEYCLGVFRLFAKFPRQVLLYLGEPPLRMPGELRGADVWFRFRVIDIRDLDGDRLSESEDIGDNLIAVLANLRDRRLAVRRVLGRIAGLPVEQREAALSQLIVLAGLRKLIAALKKEVRRMPFEINLMENELIAEFFERCRQEGELAILRQQIEKRFGPLPEWAQARLRGSAIPELEELTLRLLDARPLEDLLK